QSAHGEGEMVGAQQHQHAAERDSFWHEQRRGERTEVSQQLLPEEQAIGGKGAHGGSGGVGLPGGRSAAGRAGSPAAYAAGAGSGGAKDRQGNPAAGGGRRP